MNISTAIILAGGRGTRLPHSARDIPKPLVAIGAKSIVEHQLERLMAAGFTDIRLALGFRADQIIAFLRERGYPMSYVVEPEPLGTGGATRFAARGIEQPCLVMNGDVLADFDFPAIVRAHEPGGALLVSHWRDDARDFGLVELQGDRVLRFLEKPREPIGGHINAGCYILEPADVQAIPEGFSMLEEAVFPKLAREGRLRTHVHRGVWDDAGTEERLHRIRNSLSSFGIRA